MAILLNNQTETNLSGETLLASSSLENSINEARNASISIDSKIADLKIKAEEIKADVCDKLDQKEKSFTTSINLSATNAVNKIGKAVKELKEGSDLLKDAWKMTSTIVAHATLFIAEIVIVFWFAIPPIVEAKKSLNDNEKLLKNLREIKQENERLYKENEQLTANNKDMDGFILFLHGGDISKAQKGFRLWLKAKK